MIRTINHIVFEYLLKTIMFALSIWINFSTFGQNTYEGIILDANTLEPIPYLKVYNSLKQNGTVSRIDGTFTFTDINSQDTLLYRHILYETLTQQIDFNHQPDTIYLHPKSRLMDEVIILNDDAILYELVHNCKSVSPTSEHLAKSYYQLETFTGEKQLELYQAYNNGTFKGYDVSAIDMKAGRFFLAPLNNRLFQSMETSKTFYMHKLFKENHYFPISPFELNKRQLRKQYRLALNAKYKKDEHVFYRIQFTPKKDKEAHFSGKVVIDSATNHIHQVSLIANSVQIHPFTPLPDDTLRNINLALNKSFVNVTGEMLTESVNFNYSFEYTPSKSNPFNIRAEALIHAYNYQDEFLLPFFEFPADAHRIDYRKVIAMPVNDLFWECTNEFNLPNSSRQDNFIAKEAAINSLYFKEKRHYEHPFVSWKKDSRLVMKEYSDTNEIETQSFKTIPALRYELFAQIYMDVNVLCDSLQVITASLFDPYLSYYDYPMNPRSHAFINMYFDLVEIERQKFEAIIPTVKDDLNLLIIAYEEAKLKAVAITDQFRKEVQRGTIERAMKKWNTYIFEELAVDNMTIYGLN